MHQTASRPSAEHRCHVRLVVVTDEEKVVAALHRARERLQADVIGSAVAGEHDQATRSTEARCAARERAAHFRRTCNSCGVLKRDVEPGHVPGCARVARRRDFEATGRVTTTTGRSIVDSTVRTTSGIPQPWQRECPPRSGGTPFSLWTIIFKRDIRHPHADLVRLVAGEDRTDVIWVQVATSEPVDMPAQRRVAAVDHGGDLGVKRGCPTRGVGPIQHDRARCLRALPRHRPLGKDGTSRSAASPHALPRHAARRPCPDGACG